MNRLHPAQFSWRILDLGNISRTTDASNGDYSAVFRENRHHGHYLGCCFPLPGIGDWKNNFLDTESRCSMLCWATRASVATLPSLARGDLVSILHTCAVGWFLACQTMFEKTGYQTNKFKHYSTKVADQRIC